MVAKGLTIEQFKTALKKECKTNGWYGGREAPTIKEGDSEEGKKEKQEKYLNWRLEIIAKTNMRTAYMAGKYQEMMRGAKLRPVWVYEAVMDGSTRAKHKALNNQAFWYDHPFWDTYFPPNDWGCRCSVISLTESAARDKKLDIKKSDQEVSVPDKFAPPEWKYNVAKHKWQPDWSKYKTLNKVKVKDGNDKDIAFVTIIRQELKKNIESGKLRDNVNKLKDEKKAVAIKSLLKKLGKDNEVFKKHFDITTEVKVEDLNVNNPDKEKMRAGACRPDKTIVLDKRIATNFYMTLKKLEANTPINETEIRLISYYIHEHTHYLQSKIPSKIDNPKIDKKNLSILEGMTELMGRIFTANFLEKANIRLKKGISVDGTLNGNTAYEDEIKGIDDYIEEMGKTYLRGKIIYSFTKWTRSKDYKPHESKDHFEKIVKEIKR